MKKALYLTLCMLFGGYLPLHAQESSSGLYSSSLSAGFSQMAMDTYYADPSNPAAIEKAMTLLEAALALDSNSEAAWENMLRIGAGARVSPKDYSEEIRTALRKYVNERSNLAIARNAVAYLIDHLNTRLEREELLAKMIYYFGDKNPQFTSIMMTYEALLTIERGDFATAVRFLTSALQQDPYNRLAFMKLNDLAGRENQSLSPAVIAVQYRRALTIHPYDLKAAVALADYLRQFQVYDLAAEAFEYSENLFELLEPGGKLPPEIYRPWIMVCLRSQKKVSRCDQIARNVRGSGRFDLLVEAAAGAVAKKMGQDDQATRIWQYAAAKAEERLKANFADPEVTPEQLCWFYSFVQEQPEKALAWALEAVSLRPEGAEANALFAYALVLNNQEEMTEDYLAKAGEDNPIAMAARARVLLAGGKNGQATELLRKVAGRDPESFVSVRALELLREMDSDYFPQVPPETIQAALVSNFGDSVFAAVVPPAQRIAPKISFGGSQYLYGSDMDVRVVIENTGPEAMVIRDQAMFTGWIRIDALVRGDLNLSLPGLLERQMVPAQPIRPGQYATAQMSLLTGKLREILLTFPQADLEIEFTLWLDPIELPDGTVQNRLKGLQPVRQTIRRSPTVISNEYLIQRLDILKKGSDSQKGRVAELFAGLLAEQAAAEGRGLPYRYVKVDRTVLADALRKLLRDESWNVQMQTLIAMTRVNLPVEPALIGSVSERLNSDRWPVRLGALTALSRFESGNFGDVLEWQLKQDPFWINQRMIKALME